MPVNTANKRASCISIASPNRLRVWPIPDGSLATQADRQQMAWVYIGILATPPVIGGAAALNQWWLLWSLGMLLNPFNKMVVVTKSDTVDLADFSQSGKLTSALYVGGTGDISVVLQDGTTCLYSAVPVGVILPVAARRINSTNTNATLIVAMYQI